MGRSVPRCLVRVVRRLDGQRVVKEVWIDKAEMLQQLNLEKMLPGDLLEWEVIVTVDGK